MGFFRDVLRWILKNILFLFNFCVLVIGVLVIIFAVDISDEIAQFKIFTDKVSLGFIGVMIFVLGAIIIIISAIGGYGAFKSHLVCIYVYIGLLFVVLILQLGAMIYIVVVREEFLEAMGEAIEKIWKTDDAEMHIVEIKYKCCGVNNYQDYDLNQKDVPKSCCGDMEAECEFSDYFLRFGCKNQFVAFIAFYFDLALFGSIGVILVELVALVLAIILTGIIKQDET